MIFAPTVSRRRKKETEEQNEEQPDAKAIERTTDGQLVGFRPVYMCAVSQTEGAELPDWTKCKAIQPNNSRGSLHSFCNCQILT
jgi:hypothetical protein